MGSRSNDAATVSGMVRLELGVGNEVLRNLRLGLLEDFMQGLNELERRPELQTIFLRHAFCLNCHRLRSLLMTT